MLDTAINKTTKCRFNFGCLGKDSRYPLCTVGGTERDNVLSLNNNVDINCQYRGTSDTRYSCSCPTHYSLQNKHQWINSTSVSGKEAHPEQCQHAKGGDALPKNVGEAVKLLINELPQKYKLTIANMGADDLGESAISLIQYIQSSSGLASGNKELIRSCSESAGGGIEHPEDASAVILSRLIIELAKTHT